MIRKLWQNKWFILVSVVTLFGMASYVKVAYASTDTQLDKILKAGIDGLVAYFTWLIDVLQKIW